LGGSGRFSSDVVSLFWFFVVFVFVFVFVVLVFVAAILLDYKAMEKVIKELTRLIKPFDVGVILRALDGKKTLFDVDDRWYGSHMGHPRSIGRKKCFDGEALTAGGFAICYLATQLPVGDPLRGALPQFAHKIRERLQSKALLLYASSPEGRWVGGDYFADPIADLDDAQLYKPPREAFYKPPKTDAAYLERCKELDGQDNGGLVSAHGYLYFRPALLSREKDIALLESMADPSLYYACRAMGSAALTRLLERIEETPVEPGRWEIDPRVSAPELVARAQKDLKLDEAAATYYLQLLALCDCGDVWLREVNGWKPAQLKQAGQTLVTAGLAQEGKQPRANRALSLPGTWEKLSSPQPALEAWKLSLSLYDVQLRLGENQLLAPFDRIVPLGPAHELFAAAYERVKKGDAPRSGRSQPSEADRDWMAEIAAAPSDTDLRLVFADHLSERGDPRGELIALQCKRLELSRGEQDDKTRAEIEQLKKAEDKLLKKHGPGFTEAIHSHVEEVTYQLGFITDVTVKVTPFVPKAARVTEALPLLEGLTFYHTGGIGRIPDRQLELLGNWPGFASITRLDFTADQYLDPGALALLLEAKHLGPLRWLRFGYHRPGEGFEQAGAEALASCERLAALRFLEVAGQSIGNGGALALVESPHLSNLQMLRLPLNAINNKGGKQLVKALEGGALPELRVLDVGNAVQTDFVTKAARWFQNRVSYDTQHAILQLLAKRRGAGACYEQDTVTSAAERRAETLASRQVLTQTGRFPFAELAKSGRSRCLVCGKNIDQGTVRIGVERVFEDPYEGKRTITSWVHPQCREMCPELVNTKDLDKRLKKNSEKGVWPPTSG
jgi:uncharacterized protein (TIGR02996 family)